MRKALLLGPALVLALGSLTGCGGGANTNVAADGGSRPQDPGTEFRVSAQAQYWQDYMPGPESAGPRFTALVTLGLRNQTPERVGQAGAAELRLFREDGAEFAVLPLVTLDGSPPRVDVPAGTTVQVTYRSDPGHALLPAVEDGTLLTGKFTVTAESGQSWEVALPPIAVRHTH